MIPYNIFIYFFFLSTVFSISIIIWFIYIAFSKKNKELIDYMFISFSILCTINYILTIIPLFGYGKIVDPVDLSYYIYDHIINILYLSSGFLLTGSLNYLKLFIFDDFKSKRKIGLLIFIPFLILSIMNFIRIIKINNMTILDTIGIDILKITTSYFFLSFVFDIISIIVSTFIIKKSKNNNSIKLAKFLLSLTSITLFTNFLSIIINYIPYYKIFQQLFSIYIVIYSVIYGFGMFNLVLKYKLLSARIIYKKLLLYLIISFIILVLYIFLIEPFIYNNKIFSKLISSFSICFIILFIIIISNKFNNKIEWLLGNIIYPSLQNRLKNVYELNNNILNILDLESLNKFLEEKIFKIYFINEYCFYFKKDNKNYFELSLSKNIESPKILESDHPLISHLIESKDIIFNKKELLFENINFVIPIILRNSLLGLLAIGKIKKDRIFDEEDLNVFRFLSSNIAICLENIFLNDRLIIARTESINKQNILLKKKLENKIFDEDIIGNSAALRNILEITERVAKTDASVLIIGENGTGKELIAKKIHKESIRSKGQFIPINCAAIPDNLLESELFGYEKGAFTGAVESKKGLLELVNNGTIFFDEIGDLPLVMQGKLLRVLQEKKVIPVGGKKEISLDFRLISATNKNLEEIIKSKQFREDLFYRINVVKIRMPSLRERKEDILLLIDYFINNFNISHNKNIQGIQKDALNKLKGYNWPGNIRQLKNVIENSMIMSNSDFIKIDDLPEELLSVDDIGKDSSDLSTGFSFDEKTQRFEKELVVKALNYCNNGRIKAANFLGITRDKLNYLIKKHGID